MSSLISDVPGIVIASVNIGGGAPISTDNEFVWAEIPEAASSAINERLDAATRAVQNASALLKARDLP
jgi:hypothetical protein